MIKCFEQIKTVGIYSPGFKADIIYVQFSEIAIPKLASTSDSGLVVEDSEIISEVLPSDTDTFNQT